MMSKYGTVLCIKYRSYFLLNVLLLLLFWIFVSLIARFVFWCFISITIIHATFLFLFDRSYIFLSPSVTCYLGCFTARPLTWGCLGYFSLKFKFSISNQTTQTKYWMYLMTVFKSVKLVQKYIYFISWLKIRTKLTVKKDFLKMTSIGTL